MSYISRLSFGGFIFLTSTLLLEQVSEVLSSHDNCRIAKPVRGFCLSNKHSYRQFQFVSLERCILHCEHDTDCYSINYKEEIQLCKLNNSTKELSWMDFIQESDCIYVQSVVRRPCLSQFCEDKLCSCWCERSFQNGSCEVCGYKPLGMQNRDIKDNQITAKSSTPSYGPSRGRLGSSKGWMSRTLTTEVYLQVSFAPHKKIITHVSTQGSPIYQCWVTQYTVEYSSDSKTWRSYTDNRTDKTMVFQGNRNQNSVVKNALPKPVTVSALRVRPYRWWANCISLRMELYGCETH